MAEPRNDDKGYVRGARGFAAGNPTKGPATTTEAGKSLYEMIFPTGKVLQGQGEPTFEGKVKGSK